MAWYGEGPVVTHNDLVLMAARWLQFDMKCPIVVSGFTPYAGESPDVIGFYDGGDSVMIECKVSRADLKTDRNKVFRRIPKNGMGNYRYLAVTDDVLRGYDEIYDNWGVIVLRGDNFYIASNAKKIKTLRKDLEVSYMVGAIRNNAIPVDYRSSCIRTRSNNLSFFDKNKKYPTYVYMTKEEKKYYEILAKKEKERKELESKQRKKDLEEYIAHNEKLLIESKARQSRFNEARELIDNYNENYNFDNEPCSVGVMWEA